MATVDGRGGRQESDGVLRRRGLLAGSVTLLAAALPVAWAASLAHAAFSGCWLACGGAPDPTEGVLWAVVAAALLGVPVGVALSAARVRSWVVWGIAALAVLLAVGAWVLFSVDPANADFFVD